MVDLFIYWGCLVLGMDRVYGINCCLLWYVVLEYGIEGVVIWLFLGMLLGFLKDLWCLFLSFRGFLGFYILYGLR